MNGEVKDYISEKKPKNLKNKYLFFEEILIFFLYILIYIFIPVVTYFIFENCITDITLANTISLGAIFATFGSAIISCIILYQNDILNRILTNVDILYCDLLIEDKWRRWQFIKRFETQKLYENKYTTRILDNAKVKFNVGSHIIYIHIPTVQEDFYDLPALYNYFSMLFNKKDFKTYTLKNPKYFPVDLFNDNFKYYYAWDCLYDVWKHVIIFKFNKVCIHLGFSLVISSIIFSFFFISISNLIG